MLYNNYENKLRRCITLTIDDAKKLNRGDYIFYNNEKYKVLHVKELISSSTNEPYISIKCKNKNLIAWLTHEFVDIS